MNKNEGWEKKNEHPSGTEIIYLHNLVNDLELHSLSAFYSKL